MTQLKATPTEYRGICFRSKSEAVFARCLDLAGWGFWEYEPDCGVGGHTWDFCISGPGTGSRKDRYGNYHFSTIYIEYKPSQPTETYCDNLTEAVRSQMCKSVEGIFPLLSHCNTHTKANILSRPIGFLQDSFLLIHGSPWSQQRSVCHGTIYSCYPIWDPQTKFGTHWLRAGDCNTIDSHRNPVADLGITDSMALSAKSYRFDLE